MAAPLPHHPVIPAPLLKPPPRQVRLRPNWLSHNRSSILFFGFVAMLGAGFLLFNLAEIVFLWRAPIVTGRIIDKTVQRTSKGNPNYRIYYGYNIGSEIHSNSQTIGADRYHMFAVGSNVPINTAVIGWRRFDEMHMSAAEYWDQRMPLWVPVLLFDGSVLLVLSWVWSRHRNLVRFGEPVFGLIMTKRVHNSTRSASTYYYITYQFTDAKRSTQNAQE